MFVKYCQPLVWSVSEYWDCVLCFSQLWNISPRSPKYVTPRSLTFLEQKMPQRLWYRHQSDKNAIAAQIDPRSGHLKQDWGGVASLNFLNSQSPLAAPGPPSKIQKIFSDSSFWSPSILWVPIWILGKSLGSLGTFNSFVSAARANINVYPSLERVLYLFVYDRLTWLSRLKPALQGRTTDCKSGFWISEF